ncbi:hypothetical protein Taro_055631 [Colocasia esculenta]|uniref:C2HC zinc finger plants domain-containing protein n=1 Tax=Colocasia esculenta TaxID=4460 RepID=A0A843XUW5_COLES|nr:hypothetical protein [Colocasia esculenta]
MDVEMEVKADSGAGGGGSSDASTAKGPALHFHHHQHQQPQGPAFGARGPNVWGMLALARQLVQEGKPSLALQAVVTAVKTEGGDNAVLQALHRARELYRNKLQANTTADELATLFAKCAIAEAQPSGANTLAFDMGGATMIPNIDETSILAESGRNQIVLDAFLDGSSFVCLQCGGLVSNLRKDEHLAYWCCGQI